MVISSFSVLRFTWGYFCMYVVFQWFLNLCLAFLFSLFSLKLPLLKWHGFALLQQRAKAHYSGLGPMMLPCSHRVNNCYQYRWKQMQVLVIWPLTGFTVKQVKINSGQDKTSQVPILLIVRSTQSHCSWIGTYLQSSFKSRSYLLSQPRDCPPVGWQRILLMRAKFVLLSVVSLGSVSVVAWSVLLVGRFWRCETDAGQGGGSSAKVVSTVTSSVSLLWAGGWDQGWRMGNHREAVEISAPQLSPWILCWPAISYVWLCQTKGNMYARNLNAAPYVRVLISVGSWQP